MGDQAVAGLGAGVAVSFLACPTELIKCRIQAQGGAAAPAQACTCHMRLRMLASPVQCYPQCSSKGAIRLTC